MHAQQLFLSSLKRGYAHPTEVINALVELENQGGICALSTFYAQAEATARALQQQGHPHAPLGKAWLCSIRTYAREYGLELPTPQPQPAQFAAARPAARHWTRRATQVLLPPNLQPVG